MNRIAVMVDAGYLFAAGSTALVGRVEQRGKLMLNHSDLITALTELAEEISGARLLRVYWYDGSSAGPTAQQLALAHHENVKLRLGFVNSFGEQKGVDSLIVIDMITLARNRAVSDILLVSGDEDTRVGVQQAQEFGIRVHLLGIQGKTGNQSNFLKQEADTTRSWTPADIGRFLVVASLKPVPPPIVVAAPLPTPTVTSPTVTGDRRFDPVIRETGARLSGEELSVIATLASTGNVPRDVDRKLLGTAKAKLGVLDHDEKRALRGAFVEHCKQLVASR